MWVGPPSVSTSEEKPRWYLTSPRSRPLLDLPLELLEQDRGQLAEYVDEHVEAPPVRHPDDDLPGGPRPRPLDDLVEQRDEALAPFEGEALLPRVAGVEELLEPARRDDPAEELALLPGGEGGPPAGAFQALLHPALLPGAGEVGQLGADVGAVRGVQEVHELPEGELRGAEQRVGGERPVEVRLREPVRLRVDVRGAGPPVDLVHVQRVDVGDAVPAIAVGADEAVDGAPAVVRGRLRRPAGTKRRPGAAGRRRAVALQPVEERTPAGGAAVGIRPVAAVRIFEKRGAGGEERRFAHVGPFAVGGIRRPRGSLPDRIPGWLPAGDG